MAAHDTRAAKRYAKALFSAAQAQNALSTVERDLETVATLMQQAPALQRLWDDPLISGGKKRALLAQVLQDSISPLTLAFLRLLVDKRREEILKAIRTEMGLLADQARHLVRAEAVFAIEPTADEQTGLQRSLEQRTGEQVVLAVRVDPSILGGIVVRMQDTIIDGSVRGTLERLREQLLQETQ